jgi:predicted Holliday junction resolvase-like endonuclease
MIIIISVVIAILIIFVLMLSSMIGTLNKQIEAMDREQHEQNQDIIKLMKSNITHQEMLLQHIEILKYLVEQDPKLNSGKIYFTGPIGEA